MLEQSRRWSPLPTHGHALGETGISLKVNALRELQSASGVVYVWRYSTQDASVQASAGMYAGGDFILFTGVFCMLGLFPTGLVPYFLFRKSQTR